VKLTDLRGILQYIPQFREKTFILAIDGAIVTDENFATLLLDVAVLRSLNIRVVLVHGASAQIKALADEQNVKASDLYGGGVTDAATLNLALTAANRLTHEILEGLSANDLRATSTNAIIAHPMGIIQGVDHLFTGKVERVDVEMLQSLLNQGVVPVIPPLGFDGDGKTYRVNSDGVAVAVADALKAIKLIFITSQDGLRYNGARCSWRICKSCCSKMSPGFRRKRSRRRSMPRLPAWPEFRAFTSSMARWMRACSRKFFPMTALARSFTPMNISKSGRPRKRTSGPSNC
jgi:acetylglutamate kinase